MRKEYDFDKMIGRRNPHAKNLKKQVTMRMGVDIIEYFKKEKDSLLFEQQLIKEIGLENLCNMTQGGEGWSFNHSEETKQKLSELKKEDYKKIKVFINKAKRDIIKDITL